MMKFKVALGVMAVLMGMNSICLGYTTNPITVNKGLDLRCYGKLGSFLQSNNFRSLGGNRYSNGSMELIIDSSGGRCNEIKAYGGVITDWGGISIGSRKDEVIDAFGTCVNPARSASAEASYKNQKNIGGQLEDEAGVYLCYPTKNGQQIVFRCSHSDGCVDMIKIEKCYI